MSEEVQEQRKEQLRAQGFQPGKSGNPGGRPKGSRNKLQGDFMRRLSEDFARFGIYAIARARRDDPLGYVKVCASLMPKEVNLTRPLDEIPDEQLDAAIIAVRAIFAAQDTGVGEEAAGELQPAEKLQPISQAS